MNNHHKKKKISFVRELCKGKSEEELLVAENNFRAYVDFLMDWAEEDQSRSLIDDIDREDIL